MSDDLKKKVYKPHAIRLLSLDVLELYIRVKGPTDPRSEIDRNEVLMYSGHGEYDQDEHTISVVVKVEVGMKKGSSCPIAMKIEVGGVFQVDESRFDLDHLNAWAKNNAPLVLYPYIRENAFALTARCGLRPLILPLMEVPTLGRKKASAVKKKSAE